MAEEFHTIDDTHKLHSAFTPCQAFVLFTLIKRCIKSCNALSLGKEIGSICLALLKIMTQRYWCYLLPP